MEKVLVFPAFSGVSERYNNVDTIKIVAERWTIEFGVDF